MPYKAVVVSGILKSLYFEDIQSFFLECGEIVDIEPFPDVINSDLTNAYVVFNDVKPTPASKESSSNNSLLTVIEKVLALNGQDLQNSKICIIECPLAVAHFEEKKKKKKLIPYKKRPQEIPEVVKTVATSQDSNPAKNQNSNVDKDKTKSNIGANIELVTTVTTMAFSAFFDTVKKPFLSSKNKNETKGASTGVNASAGIGTGADANTDPNANPSAGTNAGVGVGASVNPGTTEGTVTGVDVGTCAGASTGPSASAGVDAIARVGADAVNKPPIEPAPSTLSSSPSKAKDGKDNKTPSDSAPSPPSSKGKDAKAPTDSAPTPVFLPVVPVGGPSGAVALGEEPEDD